MTILNCGARTSAIPYKLTERPVLMSDATETDPAEQLRLHVWLRHNVQAPHWLFVARVEFYNGRGGKPFAYIHRYHCDWITGERHWREFWQGDRTHGLCMVEEWVELDSLPPGAPPLKVTEICD